MGSGPVKVLASILFLGSQQFETLFDIRGGVFLGTELGCEPGQQGMLAAERVRESAYDVDAKCRVDSARGLVGELCPVGEGMQESERGWRRSPEPGWQAYGAA